MKIFKKIVVILIAIVLNSCSAVYFGTTTGGASLSSNNFRTVTMAIGTASTRSILGIGGTKKDALVLEAKKNLLQNNPLKENQALANVTVDFKSSSVLIVRGQKATVSADIVEFFARASEKSSAKVPFSDQTDNKPVEKKQTNDKPVEKKAIEKKITDSMPVDNKPVEKKPTESKADKTTGVAQPTENAPAQEIIKTEKTISTKTQGDSTPPAAPTFEPTISYSAPSEIVTSSGERYKVEAGDYFLGTLDQNGKPENGKLYGKNGRPKHIILPKSNH